MALIKREYKDGETLITAENLNDIQDAVIALEDGLFSIDNEKSGEVITITDAAKRGFRSLNIYGKTTQNGTPSIDAPVELVSVGNGGSVTVKVTKKNILPYPYKDTTKTLNGVTFTVNGDGSVTMVGTSTNSVNFWFTDYNFKLKKGVTYTLSIGNELTVSGDPFLWVATDTKEVIAGINMSNTRTVTFTPTADVNNAAVYMIASTTGSVFNGTIHPQIEVGATATQYEQYKGQKMTMATPNGLPGIPVTEGGNYTDTNGQQWLGDYIDFDRGKYVQNVGQLDFSSMVWYWEESYGMWRSQEFGNGKGRTPLLCETIPYVLLSIVESGMIGTFINAPYNIWVRNGSTTNKPTGKAYYQMLNPIETDLSAEDLAAYAALRTYKDNTTVSNDGLAYMELEYSMDAKKYLDGITGFGGNAVRIANVTLLASAWKGSNSPYSQVVNIAGITANSQVDLTPSVEQLAVFHNKDLAFVTENEDGIVTVYAIGQKPENDYVIQATITEVSV